MDQEQAVTQEKTQTFEQLKSEDYKWREGKTWSLIYYKDDKLDKVLKNAYMEFFYESTLNPMVFSSARKMESKVIDFALKMLHGHELPKSAGLLTTGGTESIIMALKSYRNRARNLFSAVYPKNEIIIPQSAHVAFEKGAELLGLKVKKAKLKNDFSVDLEHVEKLISRKTILLVGSAPQYPHGVIDDIEGLSKLALKHKLGLHVDACLGGYFLPWLDRLGYNIPTFDFRLEGVTSMSLDNHKFGYSAKGVSTLLYRDINLMSEQFFITTDWCGGLYASPSFPGTKGVGPIATAYAAIEYLGEKGFMENAKTLMESTQELKNYVTSSGRLEIIGKPLMNVFSVKAKNDDFNVFVLADLLQKRGWHVDRQQRPNAIHFILNPHHLAHIDTFKKDFDECLNELLKNPEKYENGEGNAAIYGLVAKIPKGLDRFAKNEIRKVMMQMYDRNNQTYSDQLSLDEDDWKLNLAKKFLSLKKGN